MRALEEINVKLLGMLSGATLAALLVSSAAEAQCPCATWPQTNCTASSISVTVRDPRLTDDGNNGGPERGDQGSSTLGFNLSQPAEYGCYANSYDVWVLDGGSGVTLSSITPAVLSSGGATLNGWMVDPAGFPQSFDSRAGDFRAPPAFPYTANAASAGRAISITKMESFPVGLVGSACGTLPASSNGPCTKFGYTLTVVPARPAGNGQTEFRPPWTGTQKPRISTTSIDWTRLPRMSAAGAPGRVWYDTTGLWNDFPKLIAWCRTTAYDFNSGYGPNFNAPHFNLPEYGADIHTKYESCIMHSLLDTFPDTERRQLALTAVQQGLDLYYSRKASASYIWSGGGGFSSNRLAPIAFAAVMLRDTAMQTALRSRFTTLIGPGSASVLGDEFDEDGRTYTSTRDNVTVLWGRAGCSSSDYFNVLAGNEGPKDCRDPDQYIDGGQEPGGSYQGCCSTGPYLTTAVIGYLVPEVGELILGNGSRGKEFFDYMERWKADGVWTSPDPRARRLSLHGTKPPTYYNSNLAEFLWGKYRACARTTSRNAVGQTTLAAITRGCAGQAPAASGSDSTPPSAPQLLE